MKLKSIPMELLKEKLRKVMAQTGMSLDDIAKAIGFSKDNLHKWYDGTKPRNPNDYIQLINYLDGMLNDVSEAKTPPKLIENLFSQLGKIDQAVEVYGDSMNPTFKYGSLIAISSLLGPLLITWAECYYVVDKNGLGNVRRVYASTIENSIKLSADNPDQQKYPPINRSWNHIEAIYKVRAEIIKH